MSCENFTTNGRPVGIGYDANGNAKSLAELTTLIVSSVSATSIVGLNIDSIAGFSVTEPTSGQFLTYNTDEGAWVNVTVTPGEGISNGFSQITVDGQTTIAATGEAILNIAEGSNAVDITTAGNTLTIDVNQGNIQIAQNQVTDLVTDLGQKLEDITNESLGDLADVVIDNETLAENNVLVWNGSNWENQSSPGGGITVALNDLTDVNATSPAEGDILVFKEYGDGGWYSFPQDEVFNIINAIYANKGETGATHQLVTPGDLLNFKTSNSDNAVELTVSRNTAGGLGNDIELEINLDSTLTTIASLDPPANSLIYFTGINLAATTTLSPYGRSLIGSTLAKNQIPIATGGGGVDLVSYENFFKNAFNFTDNVPINAESSGGPIITDVNKRGSPLHVSEYVSGMDVSNTDVWWDTYAPLFFNHNKLQYLASGNPHPQYASSSLSATVSSLQTSTINLSSYISANEGLWSSGAGGVTDHGALSGLGDNDHPQYATLSGAIFTGSILAPSVSATGVSATTFNGKSLAGVTYNSIQDGDILVWDNTSSVWYNSSSLSDLQTSTINLSAYIAANEALWSSGASEPSSVVSIQFETGIVTELNIGEIAWNDDYSTIDIQTSTDTTLQVGQEQVIKVRNETGDTLYNGDVVYVSGVHGTGAAKLQVAKASANTDCTIQNIVGICTQDISHNSDGFITTFGYVRDVNTSAFSVGDVVYLANTAGEYTNTQEAKPSHSIRLGTVARTHATDGIIFVKIDPGYDTTFLHDVENDPPESSGQVLIWNSTSSLYQHGGHNSLADLTVGNPHTQYATLSGATFTGNISGTNMVLTGTLEAATKSFLIDHPTKADMKLRYACLEGPENGVYYRGKTESSIIELPDYWVGLIDENSISINLTPIGHIQNSLRVNNIENNKIELASNDPIKAFFIVYATRKDVPNLLVEF